MRKVSTTQTSTWTWSADGTISQDIERVGLITRLSFLVEATPSATLQGANQPDGIFRLVQNLTITGGNRTYFTLPAVDEATGGVLWHYASMMKGLGFGHVHAAIAAPSETYVPVVFPWHIGTRPKDKWGRDNPFDLSAFIPAFRESQLTGDWRTSGNDVMDDSVTVSSAVARMIIDRVLASEAEVRAEMQAQEVVSAGGNGMIPSWSATNHPLAATTSDFDADQVNIPTGAYWYRTYGVVQDDTSNRAVRSGDEVTEYSLNSPKTNERLIQRNIEYDTIRNIEGSVLSPNSGNSESAGTEQMNEDFDSHYPEGVFAIDAWQLDPRPGNRVAQEYGLDLRGAQTGDFTIGLIISNRASGDELQLAHERFTVYDGPLA